MDLMDRAGDEGRGKARAKGSERQGGGAEARDKFGVEPGRT